MRMKGTAIDIFTGIIVLFAFGVGIVVLLYVLNQMTTQFEAAGVLGNASITTMQQGEDALLAFNTGFIFLMIGFIAMAVLLAFFVDTHPAFLIISIILMIILVPVAAILTNTFRDIVTSPQLASTSAQFDIMLQVMNNLPLFMAIGGFLVIIVLYGKMRSGGAEVGA